MRKSKASKKVAVSGRKKKIKNTATATTSNQKLRDRVVAAASALAEAKAEVALTKKRQSLLAKMYVRKEAAVAKFMEDWDKREMAKIEKALKPKAKTRRK